ncbi:CRP-like cAMP-binding protein [Granulicella aggregans]|uniref:CRP-like cAMP-binding protein n=1 Tax=Granulicella aggregans TaxID=474949 RepID=A0A7W8E6V4_9BACT|nr:Crp/Fnr family transcriptional regulator [Granulicella aggregans]MBB5061608.1 CRP-like cAMP-binding protein [Granulicella aggregans]
MSSHLESRLLSSLSSNSRNFLLSRCIEVDLPLKKCLYAADVIPADAYFITSGIASIVTAMPDGTSAEVGLIGHEGMVGGLHLLGPTKIATECFVQLNATALRIPFAFLLEAFHTNEEIRGRLLEFTQEQAVTLGQLAACNRLHETEQRLARWLLMAQDLTNSSILEFTQEFLGMMLGSRRTTVTVIAGALQRGGMIEYSRGKMRILDRERLEAAACVCYPITRSLTHDLYTHPLASHPWNHRVLVPIGLAVVHA